jgi:hypothetical protein
LLIGWSKPSRDRDMAGCGCKIFFKELQVSPLSVRFGVPRIELKCSLQMHGCIPAFASG